MTRAVEQCPFRGRAYRRRGVELARCRLLQRAPRCDRALFPVRRDACEHCCRLAPPSAERPNSVVASLLYDAASRTIASDRVSGKAIHRAMEMQRDAIRHVEVVPCRSQRGDTPPLARAPAPGRLLDRQVAVDSYTQHLRRAEPFSYLRYGDGEWLSMLGARGKNGDGHDLLPETLGLELRQSLDYAASLTPNQHNIYVGLPIAWGHGLIQAYLGSRGLAHRVHWVSAVLFPDGLRDFSTRRFLETVKDYQGPKYLVANRHLAPVAKRLGSRHVTIAGRDCYRGIDAAEKACRFRGRGLVLLCASLASECLFHRLHSHNPLGTYVDCGHLFDAMVWRPTRPEIQENADGIMDFLKEHYRPMFLDPDAGSEGHRCRAGSWPDEKPHREHWHETDT